MAEMAPWPLHLCYKPGFQEFLRSTGRVWVKWFYAPVWIGEEHLKAPRPIIMAPNHVSLIDHFVSVCKIPVHFGMGKAEFFMPPRPRSGLLSRAVSRSRTWIIKNHGMYPIMRPDPVTGQQGRFDYALYLPREHQDEILAHVQAVLPKDGIRGIEDLNGIVFTRYLLKMGEWLMWFPQGKRHIEGDAAGAKKGLGKVVLDMARDYGILASVVPTAILFRPRPGLRITPPLAQSQVMVQYAHPVDYQGLVDRYNLLDPAGDREERHELQQAFSDNVMEIVGRMLDEMRAMPTG